MPPESQLLLTAVRPPDHTRWRTLIGMSTWTAIGPDCSSPKVASDQRQMCAADQARPQEREHRWRAGRGCAGPRRCGDGYSAGAAGWTARLGRGRWVFPRDARRYTFGGWGLSGTGGTGTWVRVGVVMCTSARTASGGRSWHRPAATPGGRGSTPVLAGPPRRSWPVRGAVPGSGGGNWPPVKML